MSALFGLAFWHYLPRSFLVWTPPAMVLPPFGPFLDITLTWIYLPFLGTMVLIFSTVPLPFTLPPGLSGRFFLHPFPAITFSPFAGDVSASFAFYLAFAREVRFGRPLLV